jgi:dihydroxyacetone kinase-like predicted kinase
LNAAAPTAVALDGAALAAALRTGIHRLISREEVINKINVFPVPDGDTGTNLALTLQAVPARSCTRVSS